jgi:preprotein translocase subunit SecD
MRARLAKLKLEAAGVEMDPGNRGRYYVTLPAAASTERVKDLLTYGGKLEMRPVAPGTEVPYPDWQSANDAARKMVNASEYEVVEFRESRSLGSAKPRPSSGWVVIQIQSVISNGDIVTSKAIESPYYNRNDPAKPYQVNFELASEAAERFGQWSADHIGGGLAIVLDGVVKSAPTIQGKIGDRGQITGDFDQWEAEDLAFALECGALPVGIKVVNEEHGSFSTNNARH